MLSALDAQTELVGPADVVAPDGVREGLDRLAGAEERQEHSAEGQTTHDHDGARVPTLHRVTTAVAFFGGLF